MARNTSSIGAPAGFIWFLWGAISDEVELLARPSWKRENVSDLQRRVMSERAAERLNEQEKEGSLLPERPAVKTHRSHDTSGNEKTVIIIWKGPVTSNNLKCGLHNMNVSCMFL